MEQQSSDLKKTILRDLLPIFMITRLLIFSIGYLSSLVINKGAHGLRRPQSLLGLFFKWDSGWYYTIMKYGYSYTPGKESNVVFFPLYPYLVKLLSWVPWNPILVGYLISNIALFAAVIYFYKLIKLDYEDDDIAKQSVFYLLIFPTSFYFSIFYSEGLFLFLAIACFYYARKKKWLTASLLGFFLALTRSIGVLVIVPLLIEYFDLDLKNIRLNLRKAQKDILFLLLIPLGLISYMTFLYLKFGDFLAFSHASEVWGRRLTTVVVTLKSLSRFPYFYRLIFLSSVIFAFLLLVYLFFSRARLSYLLYFLINFCVYLSSGILEAVPRYIAILFPLYLGLSVLAKKYKFLEYVFGLFSVAILVLFTILFVNGYWLT